MSWQESIPSVHDLRAPLARAKTLAKLLQEAAPAEAPGILENLLHALEDLDALLRIAEDV